MEDERPLLHAWAMTFLCPILTYALLALIYFFRDLFQILVEAFASSPWMW